MSSGIAGGDVAAGGISATGSGGRSAPRTADVDEGLFGGAAIPPPGRASERQRDLEPVRERGETSERSAPLRSAASESSSRVAGRGQPSAGLSAWLAGAENPFAMMRRVEEDLDRVFRVFGIPRVGASFAPARELEELLTRAPALSRAAHWSPQLEVFEREGSLVVHADLPGVKRDDVEVNVDGDVLTIRGQRRQEHRETEGGYRRTERSYGTFFRQIPLPEGVETSQIQASFIDGVLEVVVPSPRGEQQRRRRVEIR